MYKGTCQPFNVRVIWKLKLSHYIWLTHSHFILDNDHIHVCDTFYVSHSSLLIWGEEFLLQIPAIVRWARKSCIVFLCTTHCTTVTSLDYWFQTPFTYWQVHLESKRSNRIEEQLASNDEIFNFLCTCMVSDFSSVKERQLLQNWTMEH